MRRLHLALMSCALLLTVLSVNIHDTTSEVASYGGEGSVTEYLYAKPVGGWPAPFLADNPATSVILQLGVEDQFRAWPFVADMAFWYVILVLASNLMVLINRKWL